VSTETSLTHPSEGLIRRVRKTPKREYGQILDPITQRLRAPAAAFEPRFYDPNKPDRPVDEALSVNVQSSLTKAGLPLTWSVNPKMQYATRITVHDCFANNLTAFHSPDPGGPTRPPNPHHGSIRGLVELHATDEDLYNRTINALAKASTIVPGTA
jgi:hypothetical protein